MKTSTISNLLLTPLLGVFLLNAAHARVVVQHFGANDPATQGFELRYLIGNAEVGPVFDDLGRDAWMIRPTSSQEAIEYVYFLTDQERADALTHGWELSATVRFIDLPGSSSQSLAFHTGNEAFWLSFSTDPEGILRVSDRMGSHYSLTESDGYYSYSLVYDPLTELAKLWVDGINTGMEFQPRSSAITESQLRLLTGEGPNHAHWNEVSFAIIPEPATMALLTGLGALLIAGIVRRRRRKGARLSGIS